MAPASGQTLERALNGPKGQETLTQGLPWVLGFSREALNVFRPGGTV
jgi:hypothetical protein